MKRNAEVASLFSELKDRKGIVIGDQLSTRNVQVPSPQLARGYSTGKQSLAAKALHERVVMMQVETEDVPHVAAERRLEIKEVGKGFHTMLVRYGFMDEPNVMRALAQCRVQHFHINLMETSFFIGREKLRPRPRRIAVFRWRDRLFIFLTNLALDATEFFRIPPNRVVELGGQVEI